MATKKKNIPSLQELKTDYHYITDKDHGGLLRQHQGKLIPNEYYYGKSTTFVDLYMQECSSLFAREEGGIRYIRVKGRYHQEAKLVWYYHKGTYPQTAVLNKNKDASDNRISNLELSSVSRRNIDPDRVVGVHQVTTGHNAYMWVATYTKNTFEERAIDADGNILHADGWKTKGWHRRRTKIVNKRSQTHIGYYMTKEKAAKALRLYTNEVEHAICRYRTDVKLKRLFMTLNGMFPNNPSGATWHYIQMLYNRGMIDESEALAYAEVLGHDDKILPLRGGVEDRHTV